MMNAMLRKDLRMVNTSVWFDEGDVALEKSRRRSLLYKKIMIFGCAAMVAQFVNAETESYGGLTWTFGTCGSAGVVVKAVQPVPNGELHIPDSLGGRPVEAIGEDFLEGDDDEDSPKITSVIIPKTVKYIGNDAFRGCPKLTSVYLPEGLEVIGEDAFKGSPLSSVEIPSTLCVLGNGAFTCSNHRYPTSKQELRGIREFSIRGGDNAMFSACNGNGIFDVSEKLLVVISPFVSDFEVPYGCRCIGDKAVTACSSLTKITFPETVEEIADEAFAACEKLTFLDFSQTVLRTISEQAFCGCTELVSVSFPVTLTEIGGSAFCGANKLKTVRFMGDAPSVNTHYKETQGKWGALYIAIKSFNSEDDWVYGGYIKTVTTYVSSLTSGWGPVPGTWQGCPIEYYDGGLSNEDDEFTTEVVLADSYGLFTPGEKVSLTIPALIGYTAKGLPSGLKLNKKTGEISGVSKKPTAADGVTVTFTKKGAEMLTTKFVVGLIPTINVTLEGDIEKCKVTGANKAYLVGKKVSLAAKGPKGTAFVGWYKDGEPWPSVDEYLNAKLKYVMTAESIDLIACFEKEKMSIDASALEVASFAVGAEIAEGEIAIVVETQSGLKSLKAMKLPSGLKLKQNKKTGLWSVFGTPKKAGSYEVILAATAKSGATETLALIIVVGDTSKLPN